MKNLKPVLLEVNANPSMRIEHEQEVRGAAFPGSDWSVADRGRLARGKATARSGNGSSVLSSPRVTAGRVFCPSETDCYVAFYLADAFIQSDVQSSANQGHTTTDHAR